jgi:heptosyltransferase-3
VTHLAGALGVPIVSLYGPSLPDAFGPWPNGHSPSQPWLHRARRQQVGNIVILQGDDLPGKTCVPCGRMGCENRHDSASHCLETLTVERVLAELRPMLRRADAQVPVAPGVAPR